MTINSALLLSSKDREHPMRRGLFIASRLIALDRAPYLEGASMIGCAQAKGVEMTSLQLGEWKAGTMA